MCWKAEYILLIIASTLIDYYCGLKMGESELKSKRKRYLIISLLSNLGILFSFKYFNFFNDSFRELFNHFNFFYGLPNFEVLLPVGISFYTFQTLSYSIDVYRGIKKPEKHLGIFALYVVFFPQLVAGPIERSTKLLPQFFEKHKPDYKRITEGLKQMLWGFFKKIVIADHLAYYVNEVYNNSGDYNGFALLIASYFFAFQIYCDFSGYSDIAIGSAKVLGYDLMENFRQPYFAKSVREFWQRWHISLSTWFKDYVYIPLGGNRVAHGRWLINIFVVFLVSGLWHGANWTFIIWGGLHGLYLVFEISTKKFRDKIYTLTALDKTPWLLNLIKGFVCFQLVSFAWVFFRAESLSDVGLILTKIFSIHSFDYVTSLDPLKFNFAFALASIVFLLLVEKLQKDFSIPYWISTKPIWLRWGLYYSLIIVTLIFAEGKSQDFVYFQF